MGTGPRYASMAVHPLELGGWSCTRGVELETPFREKDSPRNISENYGPRSRTDGREVVLSYTGIGRFYVSYL